MILLAIDTSGPQGSLALARIDDNLTLKDLSEVHWLKKAMHSEVATVELQKLMQNSQLTLQDITHVVVNIGPGSFTGLRVGISLAKSLTYALGVQLTSITSLESIAFAHSEVGDNVFVAIRAVQNFYYAASYKNATEGLIPMLKAQSVEEQNLPQLSSGFTKVLLEGKTTGLSFQTQAKDLVGFVTDKSQARHFSDWKSVEPLYIRASEAEEKLKKGLLKPV